MVYSSMGQKDELLLQSEVVSEVALITAGIHETLPHIPCLENLVSSLNGVRLRRRQCVEQKAAGMKAGEPDLHLPVGRHGFLSLYIGMKTPTGSVSAVQKARHAQLRAEGNMVVVCRTVAAAVQTLVDYALGVPTYARRVVS